MICLKRTSSTSIVSKRSASLREFYGMTFAKSVGGLLEQTKNSSPFAYHARRRTSLSKHFIGARITVDRVTVSSSRSGLLTSKFEENATRPMYGLDQKGSRCYSSGSGGSFSSIPTVRPSMNYLAMQYLLHIKNKMHFDPTLALNHFVVPDPSLADSTKKDESNEQNLDKRIRSRIAFLLESSTSDKKPSAENKKELIDFIRSANNLRSAGTEKTGVSLFPYSGATHFFARDSVNLYGKINHSEAREQLLAQLKKKCWNLMGSEKVTESIERFINNGEMADFQKGMEMMLEVILRNRRVPYGCNSYLNEVKKMRSFVSNATNTNTVIESVKIKSIYQSASLIAQDIAVQMRSNKAPFRLIFSRIVKDIPLNMPRGVEGIHISCSGRLGGVEIARTECGKYGKTSRSSFSQKIDYARAEVPTRYGNLGVKVWISYSKDKKVKKS